MRSTSDRTCELTRTVRPSWPRAASRSTSARRWAGSSPLSGSSRSSTCGSCTRAWASLTRCRMPLENPPTRRSAAWVSPTRRGPRRGGPVVGDAALAGEELDLRAGGGVGPGGLAVGDDPEPRCTAGSACGSRPSTRTVPWLGRVAPASSCSAVDFPAPLCPSRPVTPAPSAKLTSDSATVSANHLLTPVSSTALTRRPPSRSGRPGRRTLRGRRPPTRPRPGRPGRRARRR